MSGTCDENRLLDRVSKADQKFRTIHLSRLDQPTLKAGRQRTTGMFENDCFLLIAGGHRTRHTNLEISQLEERENEFECKT